MHLHFFEAPGAWQKMLPLTYTRPVADLRIGILKVYEKWLKHLNADSHSFGTEAYLSPIYPDGLLGHSIHLNANFLPNPRLVDQIREMKDGQALFFGNHLVAHYGESESAEPIDFEGEVSMIEHPWDIFRLVKQEIESDFDLLTGGRTSANITDEHSRIYGNRIFLEEGAVVRDAMLNAESGAIYLGKNSQVHEGALIKGSFALGESSHVNMGAKLKGDSSIGPHCKAGGEISNSVLLGYSSKGHDGFLGNSVIGEWCNLGADTNNSNLKNNYANVKMWDFESERFKDTGLQFCGLIMGDHSKCGINTMFNTGTTVGVSANIFGSGFPRTIIPSFAWGGSGGFSTYATKRALETAKLVMERRGVELTEDDRKMFETIFEMSADQRSWEK